MLCPHYKIVWSTEFDRLVDLNKDAANEALQKVPQIQAMIEEAIKTTDEARSALMGAQLDAQEGLRLAQLAEDTAEQASNVSFIRWEVVTWLSCFKPYAANTNALNWNFDWYFWIFI